MRTWIALAVCTLSLVFMAPRADAASCQAKCLQCTAASPNCSASCGNGVALCHDGDCDPGFNLGCCCLGGEENFCFDIPCFVRDAPVGIDSPPGYEAKSAIVSFDWALVRTTKAPHDGATVREVLYASSSAFAAGLLAAEPDSPDPGGLASVGGLPRATVERIGAEVTMRFVLEPRTGSFVELEARRHQEFVERARQALEKVLAENSGETLAGRFAVTFANGRSELLFSDSPRLAAALTAPLGRELAAAGLGGKDPVDVFLIDAGTGVSLLHSRLEG